MKQKFSFQKKNSYKMANIIKKIKVNPYKLSNNKINTPKKIINVIIR